MNKITFIIAMGLLTSEVCASTPPANTVWGFTDDTKTTLWQRCGQDSNHCVVVANTRHYVALVNRKSDSGCALGDLYIAERESASYKQFDTGTCSPNGYITKGTFHNGQYLSVDIGVGGKLIKQYPIGYWSAQKEYSGPNKPSWDKAKAAAAREKEATAEANRKNYVSRWDVSVIDTYSLGNYDHSKILKVECPIGSAFKPTVTFGIYSGSELTLTIGNVSYAVPDNAKTKVAEWNTLFKAITTATRIDVAVEGKPSESFRIDPDNAKWMFKDVQCQPHQDK